MNVLVAGAQRVDAGKTTFSAGLVAQTGAVGFKPRAGNDYWFDHDDFRYATGKGRLFGKDARTLAKASPGQLAPEDINPVHRLWKPSPGGGSGLLGQEDREFVVDRAGERYVVNGTVDVPDAVMEALPLSDAITVESVPELNDAMEQHHLPALESLAEDVATTGHAVVESYSHIARPLQTIDPDAVAVVDPLRLRVYRGERFVRACQVASRSPNEGTLEERVGDVVDLVDPVEECDLPPLRGSERDSPADVADAYSEAYDRVLSVADA
ncbi:MULTISPECIES: ATPase [Salinibaculum]|uniref:ATPase n=1 Tax=Salinibaculum TaxID=2732368 RepID=UPI0030D5E7A4